MTDIELVALSITAKLLSTELLGINSETALFYKLITEYLLNFPGSSTDAILIGDGPPV